MLQGGILILAQQTAEFAAGWYARCNGPSCYTYTHAAAIELISTKSDSFSPGAYSEIVFHCFHNDSKLPSTCAMASDPVYTKADIPRLPMDLRPLVERSFHPIFVNARVPQNSSEKCTSAWLPAVLDMTLRQRGLDIPSWKWQNYVNHALVAISEPALDVSIREANDHSSMVQIRVVTCLTKFESLRAGDDLISHARSVPDQIAFAKVPQSS
jgi:hypothetical protein